MKPADIIVAIREKNAKVLGEVPDRRAEQILKAALEVIRTNLDALEQGDTTIAGFGRFSVRMVPATEGSATPSRKRVLYIAAKPGNRATPTTPATATAKTKRTA